MFIRLTAKRWLHEDVSFEIPDITQYPTENWLKGLVAVATRHFAKLYESEGLSKELVDGALQAFLTEAGAGVDLMKSYPKAEEAGDDWRILIEMITPEARKLQGEFVDEMLARVPTTPPSKTIMTFSGIQRIED